MIHRQHGVKCERGNMQETDTISALSLNYLPSSKDTC
jgi:hypothetical protein